MAIITADMQDPPELMVQMYDYWQQGFKLVIGNRAGPRGNRAAEAVRQRAFTWLMKRMALPNIPDGGFDFVFFDRQVGEQMLRMKERNSNMFYLMVWLGYPYVNIPYVRRKREIGKSRWTIQKKVKLFIDSHAGFLVLSHPRHLGDGPDAGGSGLALRVLHHRPAAVGRDGARRAGPR